ncbi:MAG: hypothetical protein IT291_10440 [Deltaproteobacteria bacterium]|nr:hypothetical protein [Deltaproteobacteria bacterium]
MIFDTGAAVTQINTVVLDELGYSALDAHSRAVAHGPAGPLQEGYAIQQF